MMFTQESNQSSSSIAAMADAAILLAKLMQHKKEKEKQMELEKEQINILTSFDMLLF